MNTRIPEIEKSAMDEAARALEKSVAAKKCWSCGCFRNTMDAIEKALPSEKQSMSLKKVIEKGHELLRPAETDCRGCDTCFPALATNAMGPGIVESPGCSREKVEERKGWPFLPGNYTALRYQAPAAICTLTDEALAVSIVSNAHPGISIVGTLQTENLGIERLITNVISNPNIRFLVLCGTDSLQAVGHLPGQSLLALGDSGIDQDKRIVGAKGKRPILNNIAAKAIEHFRETVELVDQIGNQDPAGIMYIAEQCSVRNPGTVKPFEPEKLLKPISGYIPMKMVPDPAGYFVIYVDINRKLLSMEHYLNDGTINGIIEGKAASELYIPAIEQRLVTRLDHAAYLGKELARAERALLDETCYTQDAAPELSAISQKSEGCGCSSSRTENK